jgi:single-strand DNA-binding protein
MNKVILLGNLTRDPDLKTAASGTSICNVSIAVQRSFAKEGQQSADFFTCKAFGKTADNINRFFSKGRKIAIVGRLQNNNYEKDGQKHYTTDILIDEWDFCDSKQASASPSPAFVPTAPMFPVESRPVSPAPLPPAQAVQTAVDDYGSPPGDYDSAEQLPF